MSQKQSSSKSVYRRLFIPNQDWNDKEEFLDVIYWFRQVVGIIIGLVWGYLGLQGFFGISTFAALNSFIVYLYSIKVNNNHEDIFEYIKEGFMTAFAAFMVAWIMMYSLIYF